MYRTRSTAVLLVQLYAAGVVGPTSRLFLKIANRLGDKH